MDYAISLKVFGKTIRCDADVFTSVSTCMDVDTKAEFDVYNAGSTYVNLAATKSRAYFNREIRPHCGVQNLNERNPNSGALTRFSLLIHAPFDAYRTNLKMITCLGDGKIFRDRLAPPIQRVGNVLGALGPNFRHQGPMDQFFNFLFWQLLCCCHV